MKRILLYFVFFIFYFALWTLALAETKIPQLGKQEVFFDRFGWVHIIIRDLSTLIYDSDGRWECKSQMKRLSQEEYLLLICSQAPIEDKMRLVAQLGRYWVGKDEPWKAMNLTEEQYNDWLLTGVLKTQAYIDAKKHAALIKETIAKEKEAVAAAAAIADIKYYVDVKTGIYHQDPNCIDNVGTIEVGVFDIINYDNRKQCTKCFEVQ